MHSLPIEPAVIEFSHCPLCILLAPKLDIDIAYEVIPQVVAHIHLFNLPVLLLQFRKHLLEEVIIVFLHLHVAHVTMRSVCGLGGVLWIPVQVEQHYGLAESRFVVKPGAPVPVPAGPDLSFSVPNIEAKYSAIFTRTLQFCLLFTSLPSLRSMGSVVHRRLGSLITLSNSLVRLRGGGLRPLRRTTGRSSLNAHA